MKLPEELDNQLDARIAEYEEELKMPYVTGIERRGIEKGILIKAREAILNVLQIRFRNISLSESLVKMIKAINESAILDALFEQSMTVESVPAFEQKVTEIASKNGSE